MLFAGNLFECLCPCTLHFTRIPFESVIAAGMAPHLTPVEQDRLLKDTGAQSPVALHARLVKERARKGVSAPDLTTVRKFLRATKEMYSET